MQLNVYSNVYSINVPTIVKRIYFTDGAAVGDDSGTVRLATFIGKNGLFDLETYFGGGVKDFSLSRMLLNHYISKGRWKPDIENLFHGL